MTGVWQHPGIGYNTISYNGVARHILVLPASVLLVALGVLLVVTGLVLYPGNRRKHSRSRRHGGKAHLH